LTVLRRWQGASAETAPETGAQAAPSVPTRLAEMRRCLEKVGRAPDERRAAKRRKKNQTTAAQEKPRRPSSALRRLTVACVERTEDGEESEKRYVIVLARQSRLGKLLADDLSDAIDAACTEAVAEYEKQQQTEREEQEVIWDAVRRALDRNLRQARGARRIYTEVITVRRLPNRRPGTTAGTENNDGARDAEEDNEEDENENEEGGEEEEEEEEEGGGEDEEEEMEEDDNETTVLEAR
jgi:hypothetical protein